MGISIFTAIISALNSGLYSAWRMFAALADRGLAPRIMTKRTRNDVPFMVLLASTIDGLIAIVLNFAAPSTGIYEFIMNSTGLVALLVYAFIAATQMHMRSNMSPEEPDALKLKVWLFPWLNILVMDGAVSIEAIMMLSDSGRTQVITSLIASLALVLSWLIVRRKLAVRSHHGQEVTMPVDVKNSNMSIGRGQTAPRSSNDHIVGKAPVT